MQKYAVKVKQYKLRDEKKGVTVEDDKYIFK